MYCKNCGAGLEDTAKACPYCGLSFCEFGNNDKQQIQVNVTLGQKPKMPTYKVLGIVSLILSIVGLIIGVVCCMLYVISNVLAFIFGVAALVCAIISLKQSKSLNVTNPLSICSIVISSFDILIGLIYVIFIVLYLVLGIGAGLLTEYELLFSLI